jgi:parvulin-like peptidyl-prolyl isomerase
VSEPIKTQFGYHIIQVEKRSAKTFEEARTEIENRMRPEMARTALETMLTNANVIYDDSYFGPKEQPPAPAPIKTPPVKQ